MREREAALRRRLDAKLDEQLREARARSTRSSKAEGARPPSCPSRRPCGCTTGETVRAARPQHRRDRRRRGRRARGARRRSPTRLKARRADACRRAAIDEPPAVVDAGSRVDRRHARPRRHRRRGSRQARRGRRARQAPARGAAGPAGRSGGAPDVAAGDPAVSVSVDLQPRAGLLRELNVDRLHGGRGDRRALEKFSTSRPSPTSASCASSTATAPASCAAQSRAFLKDASARRDDSTPRRRTKAAAGATIVELKD